jgi:hypothetical protein
MIACWQSCYIDPSRSCPPPFSLSVLTSTLWKGEVAGAPAGAPTDPASRGGVTLLAATAGVRGETGVGIEVGAGAGVLSLAPRRGETRGDVPPGLGTRW